MTSSLLFFFFAVMYCSRMNFPKSHSILICQKIVCVCVRLTAETRKYIFIYPSGCPSSSYRITLLSCVLAIHPY